ncbi:NAD(+) diphosphatase [Ruminiclostridium papyrosolvens]|uniref:NAD(+) diphosphatase n=1 Tax=Ruminiclostridium papyrosolvens C7 TaxID=1330534 RepID=U4QYB9_9FIRM|nr:NAD(+) diphosphatase [Ruminiclostridium papyrosolvens]EPR08064.1 NUDIX hydrolase [Ruminiclostridium papyrosolvens C7]
MRTQNIYKNYEPAVTDANKDFKCGYWFVFCLNKLLIKNEENGAKIPVYSELAELGQALTAPLYLGKFYGQPAYCIGIADNTQAPSRMSFVDLRSTFGVLDEDSFLLASKAVQVVAWEQTHRFCGKCGSLTQDLSGERAKVCPECGFISYPRICPAVITAVFKENKILLAHARSFKGDIHSLVAGFVEAGETLEEAVEREIMEEIGIKVKDIKYWGSQPWPYPNSLMLGFTAEYESGEINVDGVEISHAEWYDVETLPELPPKVSIARKIIDWYSQGHS